MTLSRREKAMAGVVLATALAGQAYAVVVAVRDAPTFVSLFSGLGEPLPAVTRAVLGSYSYWWVLPVAFAGLSLDVLRRRTPSLPYLVAVLAGSFATALVLHAWTREALFAPMLGILRQIG